MPKTVLSESGGYNVEKCGKSYLSSTRLKSKSGWNHSYYNSMDNFIHNFKSDNSIGIKEDREKNLKWSCTSDVKTFKRRYVMLLIAGFCSMMNGIPQFQYTVIADIVSCYYGVTLTEVNWTCVVYMGVFLPLVLPVMYFIDKKGLRSTVLMGALLNFLGGWVQCFSLSTERYAIIMISQTLYAVGQVFMLSLPPFIAGVWFGAEEVGFACALGVFGNQLGVAAGFLIPPLIVDNNCTHHSNISHELSTIAYPNAATNTVMFILVLTVFQEKPPKCPSLAQAAKQNEDINYIKSLKHLCQDMSFLLLFVSYGIITGAYFAMSTIMNEMVLIHFPGKEIEAGWLGAIMVFFGMVGSISFSIIIDKTHKFKEISLIVFIIGFLLLVSYTALILLITEVWVQFVFFALIGFFTAGYLPVGLDFAAEITYPEPEAMSASLLNASCQLFSIAITIASDFLIQSYGDKASNIFLCACLLVGAITTACIKCELKRTYAGKYDSK